MQTSSDLLNTFLHVIVLLGDIESYRNISKFTTVDQFTINFSEKGRRISHSLDPDDSKQVVEVVIREVKLKIA